MTRIFYELAVVRRRVVAVVDIRSSTSILEDLKQTDHLKRWRDLLITLKQILFDARGRIGVEPYKFIGDGWVLLFPAEISKLHFTQFLIDFSIEFENKFNESIRPILQHQPPRVGLTFGVDAGDLVQVVMNEQTEYLGRAINIAARLQGKAKEIDGASDYQVLFSKNSFNAMPAPSDWIPPLRMVELTLKNVFKGENYEALAWEPLQDEESNLRKLREHWALD